MTTRDSHDTKREQYISHKLYLQRRTANRYYNLGYMMYETIFTYTVNQTGQHVYTNATPENLKDAYKNFEIALLFNPNDVDAKARKDYICKIWGPDAQIGAINGSTPTLSQVDVNTMKNEAKKIHRNCTC